MQHLITTLGPLADSFATSELADLAQAIQQHGYRCIRPRVALDELPFATEPVPWTRLGRFLTDSSIRPGSFLQFAAGDYAVQDAASLLPLTLMQLVPGQTVIDCCAAPGGKSAAILEQLAGTGWLVSNEVIASRIDTLQLTLARTGYSNYMLSHQPLDRLVDVMGEQFDCVLVDAPCTGQSLVGRGKQSISAFSEHQVAHSAARQQTILELAMQLVRPGGRLIYSTCTFAFAENEGIVSWLRERRPDWEPVILDELSQWQTPGFAGCYRLWPHRDHCAGGFAAALSRRALAPVPSPELPAGQTRPAPETRQPHTSSQDALSRRALAPVPSPELPAGQTSPAPETRQPRTSSQDALSRRALAPVPSPELPAGQTCPAPESRQPHTSSQDELSRRALAPVPSPELPAGQTSPAPKSRQPRTSPVRKTPTAWSTTRDIEHLNEWLQFAPEAQLYLRKQQIALFDPAIPEPWRDIAHCGIEAATKFGQHWQPAYPVAVLSATMSAAGSFASSPPCSPRQTTPLTDQEALTYFTGTSIHRSGPAGWQVVTWRGRPLGWAKQVGTQLKNHLPKPLRQPNLRVGP